MGIDHVPFGTDHTLQLQDPMPLDAVPYIRSPEDVTAARLKCDVDLRRFAWNVLVNPILGLLALSKMAGDRHGHVIVAKGKSDGSDNRLAVGLRTCLPDQIPKDRLPIDPCQ